MGKPFYFGSHNIFILYPFEDIVPSVPDNADVENGEGSKQILVA